MFCVESLENKSLRKRIDGINFTMVKPFENLQGTSKEGQVLFQTSIVNDTITKISQVFKFGNELGQKSKTKITLDLNDDLGIYIEVFFKEIDLFAIIQFKGSFFVNDDAFILCQTSMLTLMNKIDGYFRITTVDLAQDFLVKLNQLLPDPGMTTLDYKYCFKFKFRRYKEYSVKGEVETGYEISSSRYKIIVYDKINENERAKNILKRKYYADLYDQFIDNGVTRIEVRLKQELCKELSKLFFDLTLSEDEFIRFALSRIYSKHKLRYRPINSSDQDFRRWPVHPRWEYIFKGESKSLPIIKTSPNFLYTTPSSNVEKILGQLVEAIAHSDPSRTKEQLKEAVSRVDFESVSTKVNRRVMERELSKKHLEKIKKDMLENCKDLIDFNTGQLGIPITSPTKRNQDEYLNT